MKDLKVDYDYSVRNSSGDIIQFIYGDDGMDSTFVESQPLEIIKLSTEDILKKYYYMSTTNWSHLLIKELIPDAKTKESKIKYNQSVLTILQHKEYLLNYIFKMRNIENNIFYPIHIKRIISNFCKKEQKLSDISPVQILDNNDKLKEKLFITEDFNNNKIIHMLIDIHIHPKILINEHKIQKSEYDSIVMK